MASKDKLISAAQKFLAKGQLAKAIGEYQKLVASFPKDVRNRQKLAELLSREKRIEEALGEYEQVASYYTETGFYLKAIAVYKQMQKLDPARVEIYRKLAELNEKQGLIGNALTEYRTLVAYYEQNNLLADAVPILEKMLALDPGSLNIRAKLVEVMFATQHREKAVDFFLEMVESLQEKEEFGKIVKLYDRFRDDLTEEAVANRSLAEALLVNGQAEKAVQLFKRLLKATPEEPQILRSLAKAYSAVEDHENARLTYRHLVKLDPADLEAREQLVRLCLDNDDPEKALENLEEGRDHFSQAGQTEVLADLYEAVLEYRPDDSKIQDALAALRATGTASDGEKEAEPSGQGEGGIAGQDTSAAPEASEEGPDITESGKPEEAPADQEETPIAAATTAGGEPELELDLDLPAAGAEKAGETGDEPEAETDSPAPASAREFPADDQPPADGEAEEDELEIELEIDLENLEDLAAAGVDEEPAAESDQSGDQEDVETREDAGEATAEGGLVEEEREASSEQAPSSTEEGPATEMAAESASSAEAAEDATPDHDAEADEIVEPDEFAADSTVDFDTESAAETSSQFEECEEKKTFPEEGEGLLEEVEVLEDETPEEVEDLEELDEVVDLEEDEALEEAEVLEDASSDNEEETVVAALAGELEDASFYIQQGLFDDAERVLREAVAEHGERPELVARLADLEERRQAAGDEDEGMDFSDLISELNEEELLGAADFLGSSEDEDLAADSTQELATELDSEDTESHYNLGIAYKEMGLCEDAVAEFDKASRDPQRHVDCVTLKAQCLIELGDAETAENILRQALAREGLNQEERVTLQYELGLYYRSVDRSLEALEYFQGVADHDLFFRDVGEIVKSLRRQLNLDDEPDDDENSRRSRDRISFI